MSFIPNDTAACSDATSVYFFGLRVQQPVTAITDIFITAVCWYIFNRAGRETQKNKVTILYRYFFLVMGMATLAGGIFGHALCYRYGISAKLPGWIMSMIAIMLCERSAITHVSRILKPGLAKFLAFANIAELLIMISITCLSLNFFFVEFHALYGLLFVTGSFELYNYSKTRSAASKRILYSVAISFIAAIIHAFHISPALWFNNMDTAHCIICISAWVMYTGVKKIQTV